MLIVLGGLPGTGKTTIAWEIVALIPCAYLRIDTIEQALRSSGALAGEVGPAGYVAAYALARSNLSLGQTILADCVNPLPVTRAAWRAVAADAASRIVEVEIVCSDSAEHRRRVEQRSMTCRAWCRRPGRPCSGTTTRRGARRISSSTAQSLVRARPRS